MIPLAQRCNTPSPCTPNVQVSFQLLIPCMLFSKVAATLAAAPDTTLLLGIAAATLFQICVGALCGLVLSPLLGLRQQGGDGGGSDSSNTPSWRGRTSPEAASAIALSMAAASGAPQAAAALRPRQPAPSGGAVANACPAATSFRRGTTWRRQAGSGVHCVAAGDPSSR